MNDDSPTMRTGLAIIVLTSLLSAPVSRTVCEWSCAVESGQAAQHHCEEGTTSVSVVNAAAACGEHAGVGATVMASLRTDVRLTLPRAPASVIEPTDDGPVNAALAFIPNGGPPGPGQSQILRI